MDQIHWIAHAFTKQLAFKRPQSVIPIAKKDEDQMIPSSLLEAPDRSFETIDPYEYHLFWVLSDAADCECFDHSYGFS